MIREGFIERTLPDNVVVEITNGIAIRPCDCRLLTDSWLEFGPRVDCVLWWQPCLQHWKHLQHLQNLQHLNFYHPTVVYRSNCFDFFVRALILFTLNYRFVRFRWHFAKFFCFLCRKTRHNSIALITRPEQFAFFSETNNNTHNFFGQTQ